jgi:hypothetical protein
MFRRIVNHLTLVAAALVVALVSLHTAAQMGPASVANPAFESWVSQGFSPDEICGHPGETPHHDQCPFCHKLGETPVVRLAPREFRIALAFAWSTRPAALRFVAQSGNPNRAARAPPVVI